MAKHCDCGKPAKWCYAPGYSSGANPFLCEDCISSVDSMGCSCNWEYVKGEYGENPEGVEGVDWKWVVQEGDAYLGSITLEDQVWVKLDDKGRPWPCVEYDYDQDEDNFAWYDEYEENEETK